MSLTPDGAALAANALAEKLVGAELEVTDGQQTARQPAIVGVDGDTILLTASFSEREANFEWTTRRVVMGAAVIDEEAVDQGRKALGAVWVLEVAIEAGG